MPDGANTDRCRSLLKKCHAAEKALKELLLAKRKPSDPKVVSLRSTVRDNYEEIIFLDYAFASRKDVVSSQSNLPLLVILWVYLLTACS